MLRASNCWLAFFCRWIKSLLPLVMLQLKKVCGQNPDEDFPTPRKTRLSRTRPGGSRPPSKIRTLRRHLSNWLWMRPSESSAKRARTSAPGGGTCTTPTLRMLSKPSTLRPGLLVAVVMRAAGRTGSKVVSVTGKTTKTRPLVRQKIPRSPTMTLTGSRDVRMVGTTIQKSVPRF